MDEIEWYQRDNLTVLYDCYLRGYRFIQKGRVIYIEDAMYMDLRIIVIDTKEGILDRFRDLCTAGV